MMLPTAIQMIFLRDFPFFPLAMCLFSFAAPVGPPLPCSSGDRPGMRSRLLFPGTFF